MTRQNANLRRHLPGMGPPNSLGFPTKNRDCSTNCSPTIYRVYVQKITGREYNPAQGIN